MANIKITQLTEIVSPANDDVLPIVDVSGDITQKVKAENLPISTATQTALDAKQATLVSGTNIKTINSTSLLGSGNISIATNPAGTAGQIQFSDGSAFAADSNLFWDNTNKRLGVGTNTPSYNIDLNGTIRMQGGTGAYPFDVLPNGGFRLLNSSGNIRSIGDFLKLSGTSGLQFLSNTIVGEESTPSAQLQVKGSGSTSATTSLLVQNSAGANLFKIRDDGNILCEGGGAISSVGIVGTVYGLFGGASYEPSASLVCGGTTQGFLPPRMTTTQKNAISTPATGLMVYDTDTNKLCCYNGTSWNDLF